MQSQMFRLQYYIHTQLIREWVFNSRGLCKWKQKELLLSGDCQMGNFKIIKA